MVTQRKVVVSQLEAFCIEAMVKAGMRAEDAKVTADVLVTTDTWGVFTHGTKQLWGLLKNFRDRRMQAQGRSKVLSEGLSWALIDGCQTMPMVTSMQAMDVAIAKARQTGIAYVTVINSGHFGGAGYYVTHAADQDMIGLSMTNVDPGVAAPGSRGAVLGTNPIAYAVPAGQEKPVFLDIATSAVAAGKIYASQAAKKPIPNTWLLDKDGVPTTDPAGYPLAGALMPMAGHKGYGLAMLVEIMTAVISGAPFTKQVTSWMLDRPEPVNQSHCFIAINVGAFSPIAEFKSRMDSLIREIRNAPKAKGADRIYVPGEIEWEKRSEALAGGISLPEDVLGKLKGVAGDYQLDLDAIFS